MASWLNEIFGFISEAERRSYYLDQSRKARARAANAESDEDRQAHGPVDPGAGVIAVGGVGGGQRFCHTRTLVGGHDANRACNVVLTQIPTNVGCSQPTSCSLVSRTPTARLMADRTSIASPARHQVSNSS